MAQSDKVPHLFVKMRSVADEGTKNLNKMEGTHSFMLHGQDTLTQSQCRALNGSHSLVPLTGKSHMETCGTQSPFNSKSLSIYLNDLQYHPNEEPVQSPIQHEQSLPHGEIYHVLSALQPGNHGGACPLVRTCSSESEPIHFNRESMFSRHFTAPPSPSGHRRAYGQEKEGKRSIVTYNYIEKANIKTLRGHHNNVCQTEAKNPFKRFLDLNERLIEPVGFSLEPSVNSIPKHSESMSKSNEIPILQQAMLDSVSQEATHHALKEFASSQLRHELASNILNREHGTWHREQTCCQPWSGSPVMPRTARTLPANAQLLCPDKIRTLQDIPRSTATDPFSGDCKQVYHTMSHHTNSQTQNKLSQRVLMAEASTRQVYMHGTALPSCRPTAIQHEIPKLSITQAHNRPVSHRTCQSPCQTHKVDFSHGFLSNQPDNKLGGKKSILCASMPEVSHKIAQKPTNLSAFMKARKCSSPTLSSSDSLRSDSPSSEHHSQLYAGFHGTPTRTFSDKHFSSQENQWEWEPVQKGQYSGCCSLLLPHKESTSPTLHETLHLRNIVHTSPIQDPYQEKTELPVKDSPTIYSTQSSQCSSPRIKDKDYGPGFDSVLREIPEANRRPCMRQSLSSVSQQHWREHSYSSVRETTNKKNIHEARNPGRTLSKDSKNDLALSNFKENHSWVPAQREINDNVLVYGEQSVLSQSSSGIARSLGEVTQPKTGSISSEISTQANRRSSDTGNSAIQMESKSSVLGQSSHYEKIARAKWEFLFGKPSEDNNGGNVPSTAPSIGSFSQSSRSTPLFSIPLSSKISYSSPSLLSKSQKTLGHDAEVVNLELVDPPPSSVLGSSPKTGIIRRTIKYSETDLDAVPLRCYRETDIDEVISAEQRERNSAFTNNCSVRATSGSGSTLEGRLCPQENEEEAQFHNEEVVSWASARMHCDRKRQQTIHDEDEVFSRLPEGPENCQLDSHTALNSPITVVSPSRTSTDGLDSFSRHFESIMESHWAKGTSYSSLDSVDMVSSGPPIFTFDLPTLTPEIQSQICKSAKQIFELSFAPSFLISNTSEVLARADQNDMSMESEIADSVPSKDQIPSDMEITQRERMSCLATHSDHEVVQRLELGSNDNVANDSKADLQVAKLLAKRLYNLDGFSRSDIAKHLSKNNDFSQMVAEEYLSHFNLSGMSVDQALRVFLREFALKGETQERERVLTHFSRRYLQCNPNSIPSEDSVHTLTCALMLLNTDLHGHNVGKKMSCMQFIGNLEGLNDGKNFSKDLLKALYNSIKNEKLHWTIDEEEVHKSVSELADSRTDSASHALKRITSGRGPLVALAQQSKAQVYKNGFLIRKVHADPNGKKTPRGKRGWKTFYAILKGLVLYVQKGEYGSDKQLSEEDLKNAVSIHHSLAMIAADYRKRPNVFYLRTADWRLFLFQAPNAEQMQSWITRINTVAAMFSAPPFPAAIGSHKRFTRPLLPGSNTKLSQEEQMKSHELRFKSIASELQELCSIPQERKPKGKELEEAKQREEYLKFEKMRYGTYTMLLRAKLHLGESDLAAFEARLFAENIMQRANSSPTLPHDTSQTSASSSSASRSKKSSRSEGHRHKPAVKQ